MKEPSDYIGLRFRFVYQLHHFQNSKTLLRNHSIDISNLPRLRRNPAVARSSIKPTVQVRNLRTTTLSTHRTTYPNIPWALLRISSSISDSLNFIFKSGISASVQRSLEFSYREFSALLQRQPNGRQSMDRCSSEACTKQLAPASDALLLFE